MSPGDISTEMGHSKAIAEWEKAAAVWEKRRDKNSTLTAPKRRRTAAEMFSNLNATQPFPEASAVRAADSVRVGDAIEE